MKHPIDPPQANTLEELGVKLGQMRYDALRRVLQELSAEVLTQAVSDHQAGRPRLSVLGEEVAGLIGRAASIVEEMLSIALPYMQEDVEVRPVIPHKTGM